jgi:hypothetical protein
MYRRGPEIAVALALLVGCQRNEARPRNAPAPSDARVADASGSVDVDGLTVTFLDGGLIQLSGLDRWGKPLDTTYESAEFLRKALPVLERSITVSQAADLRVLLAGR